jgi:two-component system, sensor histidine kinase and response regulator
MIIPESPQLASVLVVDDTIENLRLLANMLGEQGYEVRPVTNGRQALQAVERDPPDLILLDINMPDMNGYEVCRRLKAGEISKDVPVIFLTALTDTADKVKAFDVGGVDYVTKPFQFEEVLARVKTHIARRRAREALAQSYARLRDLEQLRDDLVHMVVHDMRSPLMVLLGRLSLLTHPSGGNTFSDDGAADLRAAVEAAEAVNGMANDLLDVSRLEEGRMPLERSVCDLTQMAADVRAVLSGVASERHIGVDSEGPVEVSCDPAIVRRVLENLVSNGIKHTPPGSEIRISIARKDTAVLVAVHDEGPGVPSEARERIFEKFGTIDTRTQRAYHSAGLGLAFCKLAVETHGGRIAVESREPVGSTFWFELPA